MWTRTLVQVAERYGSRPLDFDAVRPFMQSGFPWHEPDREYPVRPAEEWWDALLPLFTGAFGGCGFGHEEACALAAKVRPVYTDVREWSVFDDTLDTLRDLRAAGWRHAVLSNHVPELGSLIEGLQLMPLLDCVVNSAETGFEKPHRRAYEIVLKAMGVSVANDSTMLGDNVVADVIGAEAAGLRGILVRTDDPRASRRAANLHAVRAFLP